MITEWRVSGFKSATESVTIDLPGITILVGANSSGKSAIIQSILMMAQSIGDRNQGRQVVLNGRFTRLGDYSEIKSTAAAATSRVSVGMTVDVAQLIQAAGEDRFAARLLYIADQAGEKTSKLEYTATIDKGNEDGIRSLLSPRITSSHLRMHGQEPSELFVEAAEENREARAEGLLGVGYDPRTVGSLIAGLDYRVRTCSGMLEQSRYQDADSRPVGAMMSSWIPTSLVVSYDSVQEEVSRLARELVGLTGNKQGIEKLKKTMTQSRIDAVFDMVEESIKKAPSPIKDLAKVVMQPPKTLDKLLQCLPFLSMSPTGGTQQRNIQADLQSVLRGTTPPIVTLGRVPVKSTGAAIVDMQMGRWFRYLGPLREAPRSLYPVAIGVDADDVGVRGEFTASVLDLQKDAPVRYISAVDYVALGHRSQAASASLQTAVVDWLSYLGILDDLRTADYPSGLGHQLQVAPTGSGGSLRSLTHVGVGVSQVLPMLVVCLLAPAGSFVVLEQPELHLNPAVQSKLGDFLVSQMLCQKRILLETHSDYLITRIRLRCAEWPDDSLSSKVAVYGVEAGPSGSTYRRVGISKFGASEGDWPKGFFDVLPTESSQIIRAAIRKKSGEAGQ